MGCSAEAQIGDYVDHEETEDFIEVGARVPGISDSFDRQSVLSDDFFTDASISGDDVQGFLENAPYYGGMRSWLADHRIDGKRASDALVEAAREQRINPLLLLTRIQVEKSAISKREAPSQRTIDYTMGCGCPDNRPCNEAYKGFDKQMACAARVLREHFDGSATGSGGWRRGVARNTLDPINVTPSNHATASLYAYTPWVLEGSGGNWLVWNVTKKFAAAMPNVTPTPDSDPVPDPGGPWVGDICQENANCEGPGTQSSECVNWYDENAMSLFGFCSFDCEGFCPDRAGDDVTFCVEVHHDGQCVAVSGPLNNSCRGIPGSTEVAMPRFIGNSNASMAWEVVCAPEYAATECSSGGRSGVCIDTDKQSCGGSLAGGACPGPGNIQCCLD